MVLSAAKCLSGSRYLNLIDVPASWYLSDLGTSLGRQTSKELFMTRSKLIL